MKHVGGTRSKSFTHLIDSDNTDSNNGEQEDEPCIIKHSSYYESDKLIEVMRKNKNRFSVLSTNIQSISSKMNELKLYIERLMKQDCVFSAICIQECWLSNNDETFDLQIDNYNLISQGSHCTSRGGLIIYLHENFKYTPKLELKYDTWEGQVITIKKGNYLTKPLILGNIYRPPNDLLENYTQFINEISPHLSTLGSGNTDVLLAGDYNINLLKVNEKAIIGEYFDMLTSHSFYPKITLPTRLTNNNGTLIDNFLCKLTENSIDTIAGILIDKLSDHQPYFTILNNTSPNDHTPRYIKIQNTNKESINNFNQALASSELLQSLNDSPTQDPNINYSILHKTIQTTKSTFLPEKIIKFDKHKKSKWITQSLINSITFRDNLHKKMRKTKPDTPLRQTLDTNLKTYNKI